MDLSLTAEEQAFQQEVRSFLAEKLPKDISDKNKNGRHLTKDDYVRWQRILNDQGWLAPGWPVEHGGTGWSPIQKHLFDEEIAAAYARIGSDLTDAILDDKVDECLPA